MSGLDGRPFQGYAYAYPHKTAYRPLTPPVALGPLWEGEAREGLALYLHVPFCEMRCGFCNLFTSAHPEDDEMAAYIEALERQARVIQAELGPRGFVQAAIGGGTPTYLSEAQLARLLAVLMRFCDPHKTPTSVEVSPGTASKEKLALLKAAGVARVSMGVQSVVTAETRAIGRGQAPEALFAALERLKEADFPILSLDLMYGLPGQDETSWERSLAAALSFAPDELYLYPLYVRPLTGLDRKAPTESEACWDARRLALYRYGRARLLAEGFSQESLRWFRRPQRGASASADSVGGALVGLGCGARSYTRGLHYSSEWAVGRPSVRGIIQRWCEKADAELARADRGVALNPDEQARRRVIYELLQSAAGVSAGLLDALPQLAELLARGLAERSGGRLRLTESGFERSDAIGPWLYSEAMRAQMETFPLQ